jgi:hypothetical protein
LNGSGSQIKIDGEASPLFQPRMSGIFKLYEAMAEREGFEPPIPVKVWLISSQLHSTGLCHLSAR